MKKRNVENLMLEISKASLSNTEISEKISEKVIRLYKYSILLESGQCDDYNSVFNLFQNEFIEYKVFLSWLNSNINYITKIERDYYRCLILGRLEILNNAIHDSKRIKYIKNAIKKMSDSQFNSLLIKTFSLDKKFDFSFLEETNYKEDEFYQNFDLDRIISEKNLLTTKTLKKIDEVQENKIYSEYLSDMEYRAIETYIYNSKSVEKSKTFGTRN